MDNLDRQKTQFEQRWSLRVRFLLIAGACLVPLLGVTIYVLSQSLEHSRAQILDAEIATAEVVAQMLGTMLEDNGQVLGELADSDPLRELHPIRSSEVLDQFKRARPNVYGLFILNAERELIAVAGLEPSTFATTVSFRTAIDQAMLGEEFGVSNRLTTHGWATLCRYRAHLGPGAAGRPAGRRRRSLTLGRSHQGYGASLRPRRHRDRHLRRG